MVSPRLALAGLAVTCVAAAAGGGYLANRQNVANEPVAAAAAAAAPAAVQETEAVVSRPPADLETAVAPARTPKPAPPVSRQARPEAASSREAAAPGPAPRQPAPRAREAVQASAPPARTEPAPAPAPLPTAPLLETHLAEPVAPPEPAAPQFSELVVAANSVVGLQMDTGVSSEKAAVEDQIEARVVRDVRASGEVAIPAGSRALGSVMTVDRGGRFKERARLGIRFHTLVLADGTRLPIATETIYRYGDEPGNRSAAKIGGGAVAGAILGAIIGGAKGAAVGATAGAGGGTAAVMASDRSAASFAAGTEVTARLISPVTVTIEK
jgi:hypothetical protein